MEEKVILIAEAGVNHNGDYDMACRLVDLADEAGADYVKFQTWITEELISLDAPKAEYQKVNDESLSQFEMLKKLELSFDQFRELQRYCATKKVKFLSTPDDFKSLDFLVNELKLPLIKIGSGEVTNIPFLLQVGRKVKKVILSTGMSSLEEVKQAVNAIKSGGCNQLTLLHCTSNYPAAYESVNLHAMNQLKNYFGLDVGYSDHTIGSEVSLAAVTLGATMIEKHFTLDKNLPGPDHKASMNPDELKNWVKQIRNLEKALAGSGKKEMQASETEVKKVVSKGIFLNVDVLKGEVLTLDKLSFKRPAGYIPSGEYEKVLGKKLNKQIGSGQALKWEDFE